MGGNVGNRNCNIVEGHWYGLNNWADWSGLSAGWQMRKPGHNHNSIIRAYGDPLGGLDGMNRDSTFHQGLHQNSEATSSLVLCCVQDE